MNNEGFIPRARARGHARTLRARALYGMADRGQHVVGPGTPLNGIVPPGPSAQGVYSPLRGLYTPSTARKGCAAYTLY